MSQLYVGASRILTLLAERKRESCCIAKPQIRNQRTRRTDNTGLPHSIDSTPFWGSEGQLPQPLTKF